MSGENGSLLLNTPNDVNPLNMVHILIITFLNCYLLKFKNQDAAPKPKTSAGSAVYLAYAATSFINS